MSARPPSRPRGRGLLPAALACVLLCVVAGCADRDARPLADRIADLDRPNLVLLVVDTLRPDWLEPYGATYGASPELARWASNGVVFERVLAQSSWTKTSMASILASLWPRTHGVDLPSDGLGDGAVMLAEVLRDAGYATAAVQSNGWLEQSFGFHQGFDHYVFPRAVSARKLGFSSVWPHRDHILEETQRLLDNRDATKPLFLYMHLMDVHEYAAPPELRTFGGDEKGFYLASIRWVDEALPHIETLLEQAGMGDDTVIVLASDHGETFGENQANGHAFNVFSPVLRVPLVVKLPFDVAPVRVPSQVRNLDIAPTLLDFAGVPVPDGFEGESLVPLMTGEAPAEDRPSHAALKGKIMLASRLQIALNDGGWTIVRDLEGDGGEFVFDGSIDPFEDANLVELERDRAAALRQRLDDHEGQGARPGVSRSEVWIDPAIARRLRAVGYLQ